MCLNEQQMPTHERKAKKCESALLCYNQHAPFHLCEHKWSQTKPDAQEKGFPPHSFISSSGWSTVSPTCGCSDLLSPCSEAFCSFQQCQLLLIQQKITSPCRGENADTGKQTTDQLQFSTALFPLSLAENHPTEGEARGCLELGQGSLAGHTWPAALQPFRILLGLPGAPLHRTVTKHTSQQQNEKKCKSSGIQKACHQQFDSTTVSFTN